MPQANRQEPKWAVGPETRRKGVQCPIQWRIRMFRGSRFADVPIADGEYPVQDCVVSDFRSQRGFGRRYIARLLFRICIGAAHE
jgi:hypothetical protein